jgi:hypothetical protein
MCRGGTFEQAKRNTSYFEHFKDGIIIFINQVGGIDLYGAEFLREFLTSGDGKILVPETAHPTH